MVKAEVGMEGGASERGRVLECAAEQTGEGTRVKALNG